jgi:flagellar hook-length control protein FliK
MSQLTINRSQSPAATQPADQSSGADGSGSDFGPILQAASASPGTSATQKPSQAVTGSHPRGAPRGSSAAPKDSAPPKPAQPGSNTNEQPAEAQAASAAAAAAAAASAANRGELVEIPQGAVSGCGSSDNAGASDAAIALSATATSDASAAVAGIAAKAAGSAPGSRIDAKASTPAELDGVIAGQQPRPDPGAQPPDRTRSSAAPLSTIQAGQAHTSSAREDAEAGVQGSASFETGIALASAAPAGQDARAVVQALSAEIQQIGTKSADGAQSHSGGNSALSAPAEPTGTTPGSVGSAAGSAVGGAFGSITTTYAPEGRATVPTPVGQPGFGQEFSERVVVLARGGVQSAQISLEPAGLGPVSVSIQIHGHEATLAFIAPHETTRSALEGALPRLREMFAECGMQLSDASVGGRAQPDRSAPDYSPSSSEPFTDQGTNRTGPPVEAARPVAAVRLVDTYA